MIVSMARADRISGRRLQRSITSDTTMELLGRNVDIADHTWALDLLDAAWEYWDMAFRLIPLVGKRPATNRLPLLNGRPTWKPLAERRNSREEILRWFGRDRANVGILTGVSGVVAIDCDSPANADWWCGRFPPTSMMTKTASGMHLFYRCELSTTIRNRTGLFNRRIDLRGHGGYVVAPPSIHPDGIHQYQRMGDWRLVNVPEFDPQWIADTGRAAVDKPSDISDVERVRRYIWKIHSISEHGGHNSCFRCACKIADSGIAFERGIALFREWNAECAHPQWSEKELRHKLTDAFQRNH